MPPIVEYVLFVKPTELQMKIFASILHPDKLNTIIQGSTARSLALISQLTKISNSPELAKKYDTEDLKEEAEDIRSSLEDSISSSIGNGDVETSGDIKL